MNEETNASTAQGRDGEAEHEELLAWLDTVQSVAGVGGNLAKLLHAELRLASSSLRRLLVLGLVMVPVILFAWLGFSILVSWLAYWSAVQWLTHNAAIATSIFGFAALQVGTIYLLSRIWAGYRRNLRFSATRRHLQQFGEEVSNAIQKTKG